MRKAVSALAAYARPDVWSTAGASRPALIAS
jgi:hypothetical protein